MVARSKKGSSKVTRVEVSEDEGSGEVEDDDAGAEGFKDKKPRGHRHEDKEEKKVGLRPTGRREDEPGADSVG